MKFSNFAFTALLATTTPFFASASSGLILRTADGDEKPFEACEEYADLIGRELAQVYDAIDVSSESESSESSPSIDSVPSSESSDGSGRALATVSSTSGTSGSSPTSDASESLLSLSSESSDGSDRVLITEGSESTSESTSESSSESIDSLDDSSGDRALLRGRALPSCRVLCYKFYPGTCWRAFRWCRGWRRSLESYMAEPVALVEDNSHHCVKAKLAVQAKLDELAFGMADQECAAALAKGHESKCFRIED